MGTQCNHFEFQPHIFRGFKFHRDRLLSIHSRFKRILDSCTPPLSDLSEYPERKEDIDSDVDRVSDKVEVSVFGPLKDRVSRADIAGTNEDISLREGQLSLYEITELGISEVKVRPAAIICTFDSKGKDHLSIPALAKAITQDITIMENRFPIGRRNELLYVIDSGSQRKESDDQQIKNLLAKKSNTLFWSEISSLASRINGIFELKLVQAFRKMDSYISLFETMNLRPEPQSKDLLQKAVLTVTGSFDIPPNPNNSNRYHILDMIIEDDTISGESKQHYLNKLSSGFERRLRCELVNKWSNLCGFRTNIVCQILKEFQFDTKVRNKLSSKRESQSRKELYKIIPKRLHSKRSRVEKHSTAPYLKDEGKLHEIADDLRKEMTPVKMSRKPFIVDVIDVLNEAEVTLKRVRKSYTTLKRLQVEIKGSLRRMGALDKADAKLPTLREDVVKSLFQIPEVKGCGIIDGKLQIHVQKSNTEETPPNVRDRIGIIMRSCRYQGEFDVRQIVKMPGKFDGPSVGSCLGVKESTGNWRRGTLGGFLETANQKLYAVTCGHVTQGVKEIHIKLSDGSYVALGKTSWSTIDPNIQNYLFDMIAIEIHENQKGICEKYYKNHEGHCCRCDLHIGRICDLFGQSVYKIGSETNTTDGIAEEYCLKHNDTEANLDINFLVHTPADDNTRDDSVFARPGDSGSVVFQANGNGSIKLTGMVLGGDFTVYDEFGEDEEPPFTMCFNIAKAIRKLENISGTELKLPQYNEPVHSDSRPK